MTTENGPDDGPDNGPDDGPGRQLSADQELAVTRALRELPAPAIPPALTARLDARLAELQAERTAGGPVRIGPAGGSTAHRPARRRWPRLVLAAAAVLVGGYAVGTAVDGTLTGQGGGSSSSADSTSQGAGASVDSKRLERGSSPRAVHDLSVTLHAATLRADVRRILNGGRSLDGVQGNADRPGAELPRQGCRLPASAGPGKVWLVRYEGDPALLVTRGLPGGRVRAVVHPCRGSVPEVHLTLRAP